ncbi:oxidoreductase [Lithospermum erythrorhizon]|uniref:Oxidoreductase n=1 Tax=Lithospermum erythrorhizon TaxID=34254 RepID=A0AAV3RN35_LITER
MKMEEVFTLSQVARHNLKQDCWLVIDGKVFDVTKFLEEHPGGEDVLIEYSGTDATKAFEDIGHSKKAKNLLLKYRVGHLPGFDFPVTKFTNDEPPFQKEMKAFVIKEDSKTKKTALVELFVPLLVVVFYLSYRYFFWAI